MASKTLPLRSNIPTLLERVGQAQTPRTGVPVQELTHARTHTHECWGLLFPQAAWTLSPLPVTAQEANEAGEAQSRWGVLGAEAGTLLPPGPASGKLQKAGH